MMHRFAGRVTARRRAFTLMEVVLASVILAIIGGAVSAVMMLAGRAVPSDSDGSGVAVDMSEIVAQMSLELSLATQVLATDTFYVSFVGPDLDDDGFGDDIVYGYNSTDKTLLRAAAGETSVWLSGVTDCAFSFVTGTESVRGASVSVLRTVGVRIETAGGPEIRASFHCAALPEAP